MAIIGLILGMSVPALSHMARRLRLKTATREVIGLVSLARSLAISSHTDYAVVVDSERGEIQVVNLATAESLERMVRLPQQITAAVQVGGAPAPESRLVFRPTGALGGRTTTIILADEEHQRALTVTAATGAVTIGDLDGRR